VAASLDACRKADVVFGRRAVLRHRGAAPQPPRRAGAARARSRDVAARQTEILAGAYALCAPGGRIVYATCTLLRQETQEVVDALRAARPDLALGAADRRCSASAARPFGTGSTFTVTPLHHGTDGFFASVLRRAP